MKQITDVARSSVALKKIYNAINNHYFAGTLPQVQITIQKDNRAYGYITCGSTWTNKETGELFQEINISASYLYRPIENTVATLIHECCHLYAMQNGIKDTSNNGVYHNKKFKEIAENIGHLEIKQAKTIGWSVTYPTMDTIQFCIDNSFPEFFVFRRDCFSLSTPPSGNDDNDNSTSSDNCKKSSTRKYQCPKCGNSFRATKDINVICGDCSTPFIKVK